MFIRVEKSIVGDPQLGGPVRCGRKPDQLAFPERRHGPFTYYF
jgi:hypothetical protein